MPPGSYAVHTHRMRTQPPPAEELRLLDQELSYLDARRAQLLARRAWLVNVLTAAEHGPGGRPSGPAGQGQGPGGPYAAAGPPGPAVRQRETSRPSVQNVLLILGGLLLTIAAIAFTILSWGHLGIGGRAAILGVLTLGAAATPFALLSRGLRSTAEAVGGIALALLILDAYALHRVALPDTGLATYWAIATAAVSAIWAAYGSLTRRPAPGPAASTPEGPASTPEGPASTPEGPAVRHGLGLPIPLAVLIAQLPLPLWAVAASAQARGFAVALLALATVDAVLALALPGRAARTLAAGGLAIAGPCGLALALELSVGAPDVGAAGVAAALLLWGTAVGLTVAWRLGRPATTPTSAPASTSAPAWAPGTALAIVASFVGGLAAIAAVGGVVVLGRGVDGTVAGYLLCSTALLAGTTAPVLRPVPRAPLRHGGVLAAGTVYAGVLLWATPAVIEAVAGPLSWIDRVWTGTPAGSRVLGPDLPWIGSFAVPVVAFVTAVTLAVSGRVTRGGVRTATASGAIIAGAATLVTVPYALGLHYPAVLVWLVALTVALVGTAVWIRARALARTALACAVPVAVAAVGLSLATEPATFAVLGTLLVVTATAAAVPARPGPRRERSDGSGRERSDGSESTRPGAGERPRPGTVDRPPPGGDPLRPAAMGGAAVAFATGLAVAVPAAADRPMAHVAFVVLLVPVAAALLAARLRGHPAGLAVEWAGGAAAALAVALAAVSGDQPMLAVVLALTGVIAAGTALRADRRPLATYAATALFVVAAWVRLAAWDVDTPEAYTLPVTIPALVIGHLHRRTNPEASSWTAYAPGLLTTMLPSLMAAWNDLNWTRPLLLGLAALAVTLVGARSRLQAPLLIGSGVLVADALHELTPYVVQVVDALPRWLPPALVGLVLLAVGATYERRLREARRIKDALGRMR
jgi:hypothetical protein